MVKKKVMRSMTASDAQHLLKEKHAEDIYVAECKTGSSWSSPTVQILDGWAMKKSWRNPLATGYEIKITRSDFVRDDKWTGYLPYCNAFYFVCPSGMISLKEVPADAGLMYISKTGTRLFTKKKAPYREADKLESLYKYVLMWRASIGRPTQDGDISQTAYWNKWMKIRDAEKELGHMVSRKVRELVADKVIKAECENRRLEVENQRLQEVKKVLDEMGVNLHNLQYYGIRQRIEEASKLLPGDIMQQAENLTQALQTFTTGMQMFDQDSRSTREDGQKE